MALQYNLLVDLVYVFLRISVLVIDSDCRMYERRLCSVSIFDLLTEYNRYDCKKTQRVKKDNKYYSIKLFVCYSHEHNNHPFSTTATYVRGS